MTRRTNARLAGFMFLFYIATGIAGMALFAPATSGKGTAAKLVSVAQHATLTRLAAVYSLVMMMNPFNDLALWKAPARAWRGTPLGSNVPYILQIVAPRNSGCGH